ncbi:MAG: class I SAM-dependent methyltransferase [Dehalococcoidia bacterium]|jgi:demethylmenaquinone methyltransferase/2-methoxy-6-polyprenyl-1,4-benzoquinol methylase
MSGKETKSDNKALYVRRMFADIARRYDLLNAVLSFGRDSGWRRVAMARISEVPHESILDLATGTGKIALLAARRNPASTVVGVDFCPEMLAVAKGRSVNCKSTPFIPHSWGKVKLGDTPKSLGRKNPAPLFERSVKSLDVNRVHLVQGDALRLPFPDNIFDCLTIGFALRNVTSIASLFTEMARVTKPGGKMVSLELTRPSVRVLEPLHKLYIKIVIRCIGGIVSGKWDAYTYLPQSILEFPSPQEVQKVMEAAGWRDVEIHRLTFGIATVQTGIKG